MGLLDGLLGGLMGGQQQGDNPLVQIAMQMLAGKGQNSGGLGGLIDAFRSAGLGQQMDSWISTGRNLPIDADQLSQALGSDKIRDIAAQLGMSHGEVSGGLADMLPQLIDKLTPNGQLPDTSSLEGMLGAFLKR